MNEIDPEQAWMAVLARDRNADGRFVTGVMSTGIYCRPSCAARHPRRENVRFFADGGAARAAGLRACLRCRPDELSADQQGIARAIALIDAADAPPRLEVMAQAAGYSPHHFHRLFKRATGVTPAAYARGLRARRAETALDREHSVTAALYDAGYAAPSRFYAEARDRLGMTPSAWRAGGKGVMIRWARAETDLGTLLVAATDKGICRVAFDEDESALHARFPAAVIEQGNGDFGALVEDVARKVAVPGLPLHLPLDVRGTAFQEAVWAALAEVPPGETVSYAVLAARAGHPGATRAAGSACGKNPVALLVPCHRAVRSDGAAGGYAWGMPRKAALLARERTA
ncbi:AraC family transcriptional regulator of adaptative response/methylated-DNA-[protein]-cysteine methyltransferase [Sphingomonas vulcanisoli]|uniref:AraC family transcriptional regulator of adaptative response/methylated-DNA-[protein]-cysteine methyltransferase n=1 Tax=Sphingomonas vulcanisoli TaxID=1658060 RepID=A0ABX0TP22_9SPHN|nr:bifunctional DNA-binding transcriptional regulator/O6-methylguanine-DNA methyltransferase Ada [Sphingomonas vulcanisoli]NIJ06858.1 AraC family transcriptional regulator of adaptative response/methylated-DNA-[protein]-cysteine methyltransferase [Sphingomonas vulcanisoli]